MVNNVVHLELYRSQQRQNQSLNQWLIDSGHAQPAEESFLSKDNHEKRERYAGAEGCVRMAEESDCDGESYDIESPDASECREKIRLKGPFSPLEMRVYGITNSSIGKTVRVEVSSVNTVLLDAEAQDPHTR